MLKNAYNVTLITYLFTINKKLTILKLKGYY